MASASPALAVVGLLPQQNCGDCGEPLCITFASLLVGGKRSVEECPHLTSAGRSDLSKVLLAPMQRVVIGDGRGKVVVGEERVLYRHALRFFHPTAFGILLDDDLSADDRALRLSEINALDFVRMGARLSVDAIAVRSRTGSESRFAAAVASAKTSGSLPLILVAGDAAIMRAGLTAAAEPVLICSATPENWREMAKLAVEYEVPLAVEARLEVLEELVEKVVEMGVREVVLVPRSASPGPFSSGIDEMVSLRESAIAEHRLGYPTLAYPVLAGSTAQEATWAAALTAKYAGILLLQSTAPHVVYPLLALRQAIFTDPTVPATVEPGLYTEGSPDRESPVLLTGNFAMTYSMVSSDVRSAGVNARVLVADAKGYSVGVACLLGAITAEQVAALLEETGLRDKVSHNRMIIPGLMVSLKDKLAGATKMEILVGPIDSRHIPRFIEENWRRSRRGLARPSGPGF